MINYYKYQKCGVFMDIIQNINNLTEIEMLHVLTSAKFIKYLYNGAAEYIKNQEKYDNINMLYYWIYFQLLWEIIYW